MKRLLIGLAIGGFFGLLCCGGIIAFVVHETSLTPEERAARDKEIQERLAEKEHARLLEQQKRLAEDAKKKAEQVERDLLSAEQAKIKRNADAEQYAAERAAQKLVKLKLSHPSTARFGWSTDSRKRDDGSWIVRGTVTAKNAFNLELQYEYSCRLREEENLWQELDCELSEAQ